MSRSSTGVNFACAGPRRANMWTSVIVEALSPAYTCSGSSVYSSSSAVRARIRATSNATLPTPSTATEVTPVRSQALSRSGCAS